MSDKLPKRYKEVKCHDCDKIINEGEEVMPYYTKDGDFFKCRACHTKDKTLREYRPTEVWSRIVGYIRPVNQWNDAKKQEFKDRKNYKVL